MKELRLWLGSELRARCWRSRCSSLMFAIYIGNHAAGLTVPVVTTAANKGVLLALVAMAQTLPVLTGGLDLSVGMVFILRQLPRLGRGRRQRRWRRRSASSWCSRVGALAGFVNGCIVVYGRLQPIITTLATGAVYYGIALWLRPIPGGDVQEDLADFMTYTVFEVVPTSLVLLLVVVLVVWLPFRSSVLGRGCYAAGSAEGAAYMSGVQIGRSKLAAYTLAGLLAAIAGLMLTFVTYSGEASAADRQHLHAQLDRRGGDRRHLAVSAAPAARSARSSAPSCCARSTTCCSCSTCRRSGSRCSRA